VSARISIEVDGYAGRESYVSCEIFRVPGTLQHFKGRKREEAHISMALTTMRDSAKNMSDKCEVLLNNVMVNRRESERSKSRF
jgi:hypothetical protein